MWRPGGAAESSVSFALKERLGSLESTSASLSRPSMTVGARPLYARGGWGDGLEVEMLQLRGRVESLERILESELRVALRACGDYLGAEARAGTGAAPMRPPSLEQEIALRKQRALEGEAMLQRASGRHCTLDLNASGSTTIGFSSFDESERTLRQLHSEMLMYVAKHDHKLDAHLQHALEHRVDLERVVDQWREEMSRRLDERLDAHLEQARSLRGQLEEGFEGFREAVERRCRTLELRSSEQQGIEVQTRQTIAEHLQSVKDIDETVGRLSQKLAAMEPVHEALRERQSQLQDSLEEGRVRSSTDMEELQHRLTTTIEDVRKRIDGGAAQMRQDVQQQLASLASQTSDATAEARKHLEARLQEVTAKVDASPEMARQRAESVGAALRLELRAEVDALRKQMECQALESKGRASSLAKQIRTQAEEVRAAAEVGRAAGLTADRANAAVERVEQRLGQLSERSDAEAELQRRQAERVALEAVASVQRDVANVRAQVEALKERSTAQAGELRRHAALAAEDAKSSTVSRIASEVRQQVTAMLLKSGEGVADLKLQVEGRLQELGARVDAEAEANRRQVEALAGEHRAEAVSAASSFRKQLECFELEFRGKITSFAQQLQHVAEDVHSVGTSGHAAARAADQACGAAERAEGLLKALSQRDSAREQRWEREEERARSALEKLSAELRREAADIGEQLKSSVADAGRSWLSGAERRVRELEAAGAAAAEELRSRHHEAVKEFRGHAEAEATRQAERAVEELRAAHASTLEEHTARLEAVSAAAAAPAPATTAMVVLPSPAPDAASSDEVQALTQRVEALAEDVRVATEALALARDLGAAVPEVQRHADQLEWLEAFEKQRGELRGACRELEASVADALSAVEARQRELQAQQLELEERLKPLADAHGARGRHEDATHARLAELERDVRRRGDGQERLQAALREVEAQVQACAAEWAADSAVLRERADAIQAGMSQNRLGIAGIVGAFAHAYGGSGGAYGVEDGAVVAAAT